MNTDNTDLKKKQGFGKGAVDSRLNSAVGKRAVDSRLKSAVGKGAVGRFKDRQIQGAPAQV